MREEGIEGKEHKDSSFVIVSLITDAKESISECQMKKVTHKSQLEADCTLANLMASLSLSKELCR